MDKVTEIASVSFFSKSLRSYWRWKEDYKLGKKLAVASLAGRGVKQELRVALEGAQTKNAKGGGTTINKKEGKTKGE